MRRSLLLLSATFSVAVATVVPPAASNAAPTKPNIIFILTDDQRLDTMNVMPVTSSRFNVTFTPAFVVDPWCCPSRATILTGEYPHNTGVLDNGIPSYNEFVARHADSLAPWLQQAGYYTGFVGKYFNGFAPRSEAVPPGWDEFYGFSGAGLSGTSTRVYTDFPLRERWFDGTTVRDTVVDYTNSYSTSVFASRADRFIRRAADPRFNPSGKPWALFVWPNAPHAPYTPEAKYSSAPVPAWQDSPSFFESDLSDKPAEVLDALEKATTPSQTRWARVLHLRTLMSVDDLVSKLFGTIDELGMGSKTVGLFSSDNGLFFGEHGLAGKRYAYEESIRVPFRMYLPGVGTRQFSVMTTNLDIAPTLMNLAGDATVRDFDGMSILDVTSGRKPPRTAELLEAFGTTEIAPWFRYDGLRTRRYKYIRWQSGNTELYDLISDPYELQNIAPLQPSLVNQLQQMVDGLKLK